MCYTTARLKKAGLILPALLVAAMALFGSCSSADNTYETTPGPAGGPTGGSDDGSSQPALLSVWDVYSVSYRDRNGNISTYQKPDVTGKLQFSSTFIVRAKVDKLNLDINIDGNFEINSNVVKMTAVDGKVYYSQWKVSDKTLEFTWGVENEYTFFGTH